MWYIDNEIVNLIENLNVFIYIILIKLIVVII